MKSKIFNCAALYAGVALACAFGAYGQTRNTPLVTGGFNLDMKRTAETQYYVSETEVLSYAMNGDRTGRDVYTLYLKCNPSTIPGKNGYEYTCMKFKIRTGESDEILIPALEKWSYTYFDGIDEKKQTFGIEFAKFANLIDANGGAIEQDKAYQVYNAFIDFHAISDVFGERTLEGKGIQDLKKIGDRIIHAAAYSEAPVGFEHSISRGSYFRNGEITLGLKGLSTVNGQPCALLDYDSGESSLRMVIKPMPEMEVTVAGTSHYWGDIYKDLDSGWIQKATLREVVIIETTLPVPPHTVNSVAERNILLRNVPEEEIVQ